jgi:hypothetical protein
MTTETSGPRSGAASAGGVDLVGASVLMVGLFHAGFENPGELHAL